MLYLVLVSSVLVTPGGRLYASAPETRSRVRTLLDYFEGGRRAVDAFVVDHSRDRPPLAAVIERAKRSCVRVEIRTNELEDRYQAASASGVLIDGGRRVLTAGHAIAEEDSQIVVTLVSGESRTFRVIDSRYEVYGGADRDWAVLEVVGPPVTSHPSAVLADADPAALVIVLGYPDRIGVDRRGSVRFDSGPEGHYLAPLTTLGRVAGQDPLRLSPVAGAVPTSGMSGAPVFDDRGRVVGIFVSIGKATSEAGVAYTYNATSVDALVERSLP